PFNSSQTPANNSQQQQQPLGLNIHGLTHNDPSESSQPLSSFLPPPLQHQQQQHHSTTADHQGTSELPSLSSSTLVSTAETTGTVMPASVGSNWNDDRGNHGNSGVGGGN